MIRRFARSSLGSQRAKDAVCVLGMALAAACGRERVQEARTSPTDTVVQRVVRVRRVPSAMQRVTQRLEARRALIPLDTALVVRVLDARGSEFAGARVDWTATDTGDGARLHVIDSVTDDSGLARASFVPGRSVSPQIVRATVQGVGAIDFAVTIPVVRLQLTASADSIWSGDSIDLTATLFDAAATALDRGTVSWASADTTVLRVRPTGALHARLYGVLAGGTEVVAWAGQVRADKAVSVQPVTNGTISTLDGGALPDLSLTISERGWLDTIRVVNHRFTARVPPRDVVDVRVGVDPQGTQYHSAEVRILAQRDLHVVNVALIPRVWRIDAGSYAGRLVPIDAIAALRPVAGRAPFWRVAPISGRGPKTLLGWRTEDLPIRIAFDRRSSEGQVTAADSVAFWTSARRMEDDLGARFFEPVTYDAGARGVVSVVVHAQASEGHTFVAWTQSGDATDAELRFRSEATLRDPHVATQELLHLLGFGHSVWWPTVARPSGDEETRLTREDVAYVQVSQRLRAVQARTGAHPGLPPEDR